DSTFESSRPRTPNRAVESSPTSAVCSNFSIFPFCGSTVIVAVVSAVQPGAVTSTPLSPTKSGASIVFDSMLSARSSGVSVGVSVGESAGSVGGVVGSVGGAAGGWYLTALVADEVRSFDRLQIDAQCSFVRSFRRRLRGRIGGVRGRSRRFGRRVRRLIDEFVGQRVDGEPDRRGEDVEGLLTDVVDRVGRLMIVRIVLLTDRAAEHLGLLGGLRAVGAGEQAAGRNAVVDEGLVVRAPGEVRADVRLVDVGEVVGEDLLEFGRAIGHVDVIGD